MHRPGRSRPSGSSVRPGVMLCVGSRFCVVADAPMLVMCIVRRAAYAEAQSLAQRLAANARQCSRAAQAHVRCHRAPRGTLDGLVDSLVRRAGPTRNRLSARVSANRPRHPPGVRYSRWALRPKLRMHNAVPSARYCVPVAMPSFRRVRPGRLSPDALPDMQLTCRFASSLQVKAMHVRLAGEPFARRTVPAD